MAYLENSHTKKVLVLCQRKNTNSISNKNYVDNTTLNIQIYLQNLLNTTNIEIEYLGTHGTNNTAKYNHTFMFNTTSKDGKTNEFIKNHKKYYDIILFYTCPLMLMLNKDKNLMKGIYQIMKDDGTLLIRGTKFVKFNGPPIHNKKNIFQNNGLKYNSTRNNYNKIINVNNTKKNN